MRCPPNTLRAVAFDLKAFFVVIGKNPVGVTVVQLADRESGLSARTIAPRLSSVSGRDRVASLPMLRLPSHQMVRRWCADGPE